MEIKTIISGAYSCNTYVVSIGKEAFIVDTGIRSKAVLNYIKENDLNINFILVTHGHFDHCLCLSEFTNLGIKAYISKEDYDLILSDGSVASRVGMEFPPFKAEFISDGDEIDFLDNKIRVISTSGHTKGSLCFIFKDYIFTGDTLFHLSVGRTDLPSGNENELLNSLKKLSNLDKDYRVLAGHGQQTTIFYEKDNNPYLR